MKLDSLFVHHLPKSEKTQAIRPFAEGFVLESCLRWVSVSRLPSPVSRETETYHGPEAYRFLLELACGLHSRMQGESEIFGQMKQAWKAYHAAEPLASRGLHRLMQNLFADTKRIRTAHLHGIGGQSYPSAVQKVLGLRKTDSLLILGAGQFGAMLAQKLCGKAASLTVMNRSPHPLVAEPGWARLEENIHAATHLLVALPCAADPALDERIQKCWSQKKHGRLLHLAQATGYPAGWADLPRFHGLAEVMALQSDQSAARPAAIAAAFDAARRAAEDRLAGYGIRDTGYAAISQQVA